MDRRVMPLLHTNTVVSSEVQFMRTCAVCTAPLTHSLNPHPSVRLHLTSPLTTPCPVEHGAEPGQQRDEEQERDRVALRRKGRAQHD